MEARFEAIQKLAAADVAKGWTPELVRLFQFEKRERREKKKSLVSASITIISPPDSEQANNLTIPQEKIKHIMSAFRETEIEEQRLRQKYGIRD